MCLFAVMLSSEDWIAKIDANLLHGQQLSLSRQERWQSEPTSAYLKILFSSVVPASAAFKPAVRGSIPLGVESAGDAILVDRFVNGREVTGLGRSNADVR